MLDLESVHSTDRLTIEPLVPAHAAELFVPLCDPRLYALIPEAPPASEEALRARYQRLAGRRSPDGAELWLNWVLRAGADAVGTLQATVAGRRGSIAYVVFVAHQRRGYATLGTRWVLGWLSAELGVTSARATVDTRNAASIALLRRLGFELIGTGPSADTPGADDHGFERALGPP